MLFLQKALYNFPALVKFSRVSVLCNVVNSVAGCGIITISSAPSYTNASKKSRPEGDYQRGWHGGRWHHWHHGQGVLPPSLPTHLLQVDRVQCCGEESGCGANSSLGVRSCSGWSCTASRLAAMLPPKILICILKPFSTAQIGFWVLGELLLGHQFSSVLRTSCCFSFQGNWHLYQLLSKNVLLFMFFISFGTAWP